MGVVVRDYIVCYFDFLGQRSGLLKKVRESIDIDSVQSEVDKVSESIKIFNELVRGIRKMIVEQPEKLFSVMKVPDEIKGALLDKIKGCHLGLQQFSDSTLFYANLEGEDCFGLGVFVSWCLILAVNFIKVLSEHLTIRGGITLGKGWEIEPDCLYGPVIEDVYAIESKIAEFPRIVVSENVYQRLGVLDLQQNLLPFKFNRSDFFSMDYDGVYILDYLSVPATIWYETMMSENRTNLIHAFSESLRYIRTEYNSLKGKVSQDPACAKDTRKLAYLISYWQQRMDSIIAHFSLQSASQDEQGGHADSAIVSSESVPPTVMIDNDSVTNSNNN